MARKAKRRKPGTGSIRFKKGRERPWEAAFPLGAGDYRYHSFATRPEADAYLDRLTEERDRSSAPRNIPGGSQRVGVFLTTWLNTKRPHIKAKTLAHYQYACELAMPHIGGLRLDEVAREHADAFIAYFHRRRFKALAQLRAVLRQAFEYALEEEYIARNPFQRVRVPYVEHRRGIALTKEQRMQLLDAACTEDNPDIPLLPLWHLYSRLGLRRGEGMGLRWCDIDWASGTITVVQQYTALGGKTILSTPKTKRSRRAIPAPTDLLTILRSAFDDQIRRAAGDPAWVVTGLVFVGPRGAHLTVGQVSYLWSKLRARAGIPHQITIHDLRHTALTILELGGTPYNVIQTIAGHASALMTRHYTDHAGLDDMRRALEA